MNSAQYVSNYLEELKKQGLALMLIAWKIALACVGWAYVFGAAGEYCTPANRRSYFKSKGADHPQIAEKCQVIRPKDPVASCDGCKWYPGGLLTQFFDCRGFTRWVLKVVFGWTLQGSGCTSQWNTESNWKAKGEIKDGIPKDTLCCLFYYKKDKKGNRTKTLSHTGFYLNGETVECSNGVQHKTKLDKKWEVWGIPACVESEEVTMPSQPVEEPKTTNPTLKKGMKGDWVTLLQNKLILKGYPLPKYGADGDFGQETLNAVKAFQKANGLKADGVVGEKTWEALDKGEKVQLFTVTVKGLTKAVAEEIKAKYGGVITEE